MKHKLLVAKIGANITFSSSNKSAANADILYFLRTLDHSQFEVTIVTHHTRNTLIPKPLIFKEIEDSDWSFDDYDSILIFNGSINFFGGAESLGLKGLYQKLANSAIPIRWANTDGALLFKQIEPLVSKRDWRKDYMNGQMHIDPKRVTYLTQARHTETIANLIQSNVNHVQAPKVEHFPWDKTIWSKHQNYFRKKITPMSKRQWHVIYGGAPRNTYRRKRIEFFYGALPDSLNVKLFGNLTSLKVDNCLVAGKVSYQQFVKETMEGKSTIIIGDEFYEDNFYTLRMHESILAGTIVLIDNKFDSHHLFFGRDSRFDKCFIREAKEAVTVLTDISKNYPGGLDAFALDQYNCLNGLVDPIKLTNDLTDLLNI